LFVDDDRNFLEGIQRALRGQRHVWDMVFVDGGDKAIEEINKNGIDVIVTDVKMPGKDGFKVLQAIRESKAHQDVPVILLTGHGDDELKSVALSMGAYDLLTKPVSNEDLMVRLRAAIHTKTIQDELKEANASLEQKVAERTMELEQSRLEIIWKLANAVERRDGHTENHIVRVGCYARITGESLRLPREIVKFLFLATPLHDIGKIAIPDAILQKPGPLTDEERGVMQSHCNIGTEMLLREARGMKPYLEWLGQNVSASIPPPSANRFLKTAASITQTHHERWDGQGYPDRLFGSDIPLEGRIAALADVYDALCSKRPYKAPVNEGEACAILRDNSGKHFDPAVVDAFERMEREVREVRKEFPDQDGAAS
jgi:putative two-component system response regulator